MAEPLDSRVEEILQGGSPPLLSRIEKLLKEGGAGGGVSPEQIAAAVEAYLDEHGVVTDVDSELSSTSENPVQNKAINAAITGKLDKSQGAANAGKFMVVGSDGNITAVTMTAWQGGSY